MPRAKAEAQRKPIPLFEGFSPEEEIWDLFAGGGGASKGIEMGGFRHIHGAINHDSQAISMHTANHQRTKHYISDVFEVDPVKATEGRPVGLLWASPDCKHHSKAKGGKPVEKKIRSLAWVVCKWAGKVKPRIIMLENVEEFRHWGPLCQKRKDGKPVFLKNGQPHMIPNPKKKGKTFKRFVKHLQGLGYTVEWKELRACDFGAPTTRKRLFLVARRDGLPITWPTPSHGPKTSAPVQAGKRKPYRTAAEIINWELPSHSIFLTKEEAKQHGIKRPLAHNTLKRIGKGTDKFLYNDPDPFIVSYYGHKATHGDFRGVSLQEPIPTQSTSNRFALVSPHIIKANHTGKGYDTFRGQGMKQPLWTATQKPGFALITAFLNKHYTGVVGSSLQDPVHTITSVDHHTLSTLHISPVMATPALQPLTAALLVKVNHKHDHFQGGTLNGPIPTLTAKNGFALSTLQLIPHITKFRTGSIGAHINTPLPTIVAGGEPQRPSAAPHALGLLSAKVSQIAGPKPQISKDLIFGCFLVLRRNAFGKDFRDPTPTLTAGGGHLGVVSFITKYYGAEKHAHSTQKPIDALTTKARFAVANVMCSSPERTSEREQQVIEFLREYCDRDSNLVQIHGQWYKIVDITLRMLEPEELYAAQGFPADYITDRTDTGKKLPKSARVRMCGNSVCPPVAAALVRANYYEFGIPAAASGD